MALIVDFPSHRPDLHIAVDRRAPPMTATPPRSRRVSFGQEIKVNFVRSLVWEHKSDIWLSADEMALFKASLAYEVWALRRSLGGSCTAEALLKREDDENFTMMGLENHLSSSACRTVEARRRATRRAVMFEQERQRRSGSSDPDLLANVSEVASVVSRRRARIVGLLLEKDRR